MAKTFLVTDAITDIPTHNVFISQTKKGPIKQVTRRVEFDCSLENKTRLLVESSSHVYTIKTHIIIFYVIFIYLYLKK